MYFRPEFTSGSPWDTWWMIPEEIMQKMLGVLGFEKIEVNYRYHKTTSGKRLLYTMVAHRLAGKYG